MKVCWAAAAEQDRADIVVTTGFILALVAGALISKIRRGG
jgi:hypothetical protein